MRCWPRSCLSPRNTWAAYLSASCLIAPSRAFARPHWTHSTPSLAPTVACSSAPLTGVPRFQGSKEAEVTFQPRQRGCLAKQRRRPWTSLCCTLSRNHPCSSTASSRTFPLEASGEVQRIRCPRVGNLSGKVGLFWFSETVSTLSSQII